jgi:dTDP-4-amino-4,6-dideoxygalactose transaminase
MPVSTAEIPLFDPGPRLARCREGLRGAFEAVLSRGAFVLGSAVSSFEAELGAYLGGGEVVGVASGSDALELALRALGVGPGHGVVTTPFSFVATAEAICHAGAVPVFVDVNPGDLLLDLEAVERELEALPQGRDGRRRLPSGEEVRALMPVHLFGAVVDPERARGICERFGLVLVEDTAQGLGGQREGKRAGALGDAGCFSFFPSKTLGGLGDGGAVWAREGAVIRRLRGLRQHGQPSKSEPSAELGRNSRLDAMQAAFLSVFLQQLDDEIEERRALLRRYREGLRGGAVEPIGPASLDGHAAQQMVIRCEDREELAAHLRRRGIGTAVYYPHALHQLAPFRVCPALGTLENAEEAARQLLALPLFPGLPAEAVERVCEAVLEHGRRYGSLLR